MKLIVGTYILSKISIIFKDILIYNFEIYLLKYTIISRIQNQTAYYINDPLPHVITRDILFNCHIYFSLRSLFSLPIYH